MTSVLRRPLMRSLRIIREAYQHGPYQQLHLRTEMDFLSTLAERDLRISSETLRDFSKLVRPVDSPVDGEPLYHPYQGWIVHQLLSQVDSPFRLGVLRPVPSERLVEWANRMHKAAVASLDRLQSAANEFYAILSLLSLIEPYYLPLMRRTLSVRDGSTQDYNKWRAGFGLREALERTGLGIEQVKIWHDRLAMDAWTADSAPEWFPLIRYARYGKRRKLRGKIALAHDYYEMAEMLRHLVFSVAGEKLEVENAYGDFQWEDELKSTTEPVADRVVLKRIVRGFGLDMGYRGYWLVEGDTEFGFFQELSRKKGISLEEIGIRLVSLGGSGDVAGVKAKAASRMRADAFTGQLASYRADEIFVYFGVDDDQGMHEGLERLRRLRLVTAGFRLWQPDFEGASFSDSELIAVLIDYMGATGNPEAYLTEEEIEVARANRTGRRRATGEALKIIAGRKAPLAGFGKGIRWGEALARYALEHPDLRGHKRQALDAFDYALSMTWADFKGTFGHMECDPSGKMIPKDKATANEAPR